MIIIATHHKTGHHLLHYFFTELSVHLGLRYHDVSRMNFVPRGTDIVLFEHNPRGPSNFSTYRCEVPVCQDDFGIHMIRHPYEVLVSGYHWHLGPHHQKGDEYRKALQDHGVAFEMRNVAKETIDAMCRWDYEDNRFLNVQLESFWDDFGETAKRIGKHLGLVVDDNFLSRVRHLDIRHGIEKRYVTNTTGKKWKWVDELTERDKKLFSEIFAADVFSKLGYGERG